jgi:uncharacterized membrane protein YfcA
MSLLIFALVGAFAQLIDGTLGMAFGITSSTLLVAVGATPLAASAAVHFAELGTTFASGASHWRVKNVDWRIVVRIGIPGAIGAAIGSSLLSRISLEGSRTWMSALLFLLGAILLTRFGLHRPVIRPFGRKPKTSVLAPLGLVAGFVDASGGGGWGPITTPSLLLLTSGEPRKVIGTVSASEFFVALAASGGFIAGSATSDLDWQVIAGLLLGGVLMAPFAALLAGRLPHAPFGTLIGGAIVLINGRVLLNAAASPTWVVTGFFVFTAAMISVLVRKSWLREHQEGVEHSFFEQDSN